MRESELRYTAEAIIANPDNESPWRYLRGLHKGDNDSLVSNPEVSTLCLDVLKKRPHCVFALSLLLDLLCYGFQPSDEFERIVESLRNSDSDPSDYKLASTVCSILENVDAMRSNYWSWRKSNLPAQAC